MGWGVCLGEGRLLTSHLPSSPPRARIPCPLLLLTRHFPSSPRAPLSLARIPRPYPLPSSRLALFAPCPLRPSTHPYPLALFALLTTSSFVPPSGLEARGGGYGAQGQRRLLLEPAHGLAHAEPAVRHAVEAYGPAVVHAPALLPFSPSERVWGVGHTALRGSKTGRLLLASSETKPSEGGATSMCVISLTAK